MININSELISAEELIKLFHRAWNIGMKKLITG